MLQLEPYKGRSRKLVIAIDIGTTYSGVSYCVLDPGEIPKVLSVTRFPGQEGENKSRDVKTPSVLYYDQQDHLRAVGAETTLENIKEEAYSQDWKHVKWFKLHLRPSSILPGAALPPIDVDKPVIEILADYLAYVFRCAKNFISETNPIGRQVLNSDTPIDFVLSHPNGWAGPQQNTMRRAAILAKLIPDNVKGASRLQFVTEGEASLQFCIATGLGEDVIHENSIVTIVDCGGGTIDLSTYRVVGSRPVLVEECVVPECLIQGSTMVNHRAEQLLKDKLRQSRFSTADDLDAMMTSFDTMTKPTFRDSSATSYIKFGGPRDTDDTYNIRRGILSLSGSEMASLFQPSIDAIKTAIDSQLSGVDMNLATLLLVGGFATSPFLRAGLQAHSDSKGLRMYSPEGQTSKAVAEGALWFYIDRRVRARTARYTYGSPCARSYEPSNPEHIRRQHLLYTFPDGKLTLDEAFACIIRKGTLVTETTEYNFHFSTHTRDRNEHSISTSVMSYRGAEIAPAWRDEEPDMFSVACTVTATEAESSWRRGDGPLGPYWWQNYEVILLLGLTEIQAQIAWWEDGVQRRTPAIIVYDDEE
ncbi:uncharacterized protein C8Q71DRAFT_744470 [Rhodofomes roseus]|uniref:Actin-like ATPase domain-containing protein n=1 Tax=Rhodofomes roseus TaxID=34475 RepID=A0ABQ8KNW9_9APHY|nr:uncharacterized protein C8Q71DRAFT_744470 [Rhodofomes roseus]KAH9839845.1 hypothetical protein C8Q71DRAFT_744470 [Rhodofomes roseus]